MNQEDRRIARLDGSFLPIHATPQTDDRSRPLLQAILAIRGRESCDRAGRSTTQGKAIEINAIALRLLENFASFVWLAALIVDVI